MYLFFHAGSWRSAVISVCLTLLANTEFQNLKLLWHNSRSRHQRARDQILLACLVSMVVIALVALLWRRRQQLIQWWWRTIADLLPQDNAEQPANLSQQDVDAVMRRLHALPIETWRPINTLSNRELRLRLERLGLSPQLERGEALVAVEERTESVCAVCQDEFGDGVIVRSLQRCRHSYHVECIDKWVCVESGKGRFPKCPLCNFPI